MEETTLALGSESGTIVMKPGACLVSTLFLLVGSLRCILRVPLLLLQQIMLLLLLLLLLLLILLLMHVPLPNYRSHVLHVRTEIQAKCWKTGFR